MIPYYKNSFRYGKKLAEFIGHLAKKIRDRFVLPQNSQKRTAQNPGNIPVAQILFFFKI